MASVDTRSSNVTVVHFCPHDGGVATGTVPTSTLVSFIPSLLAMVFYGRRRDVARLRAKYQAIRPRNRAPRECLQDFQ